MKRLLVTGGCGFIGSNFIRLCLQRCPAVRLVNLDKLTYAGNLENLADVAEDARYRFVRGDIGDAGLLEELFAAVGKLAQLVLSPAIDRSWRELSVRTARAGLDARQDLDALVDGGDGPDRELALPDGVHDVLAQHQVLHV